MHANITAPAAARTIPPAGIATDGGAARLANILAFEANGLPVLTAAFPGLRHERKGLRIEWFMRVGRSLGAQGLSLKGDLSLDCPCCDETSEILDAMAENADILAGRADLDAAIKDEVQFLDGRLRDALGALRRIVKSDLQAKGRDARSYLAALEGELSGRTIELYPVASQSGTARYRPAVHVRETVEAGLAVARKRSAVASKPIAAKPVAPAPAARPGRDARKRQERQPARPGRPFRMRRTSPLYE